jgi:hypothetical protein
MSDPTKTDRDELDLEAETVRDLDADEQADDVVGGVGQNTAACHTAACPTTGY